MSLSAGFRIGPFEIVAPLGVGGMGEVYRARDSKLNREVALKVLPPSVGDDPDRLSRFRREAQVLASLNHPNIAHIHGFEDSPSTGSEQAGMHALIMELVEGRTLAEQIAAGPIPLADALLIAKQIAEALEAAHELGIIHRDLKPANIKVRDDGVVKVLDFGLAKALDPMSSIDAGRSAAAMNSPTLTARATQLGVILGTAAYMAPEQAKGRPVDRRADIWAFGVVLFEMVSGKRGYEAEDISETLAAVLTREVDWTAMPASTPARLKALIRDCLVRDPRQRLRDIGDARRALEHMIEGAADEVAASQATAAATTAPAWRRALPWALAASAISVAAFTTYRSMNPRAAAPVAVTRAIASLPDQSVLLNVSRDGSRIVWTDFNGKVSILKTRQTDQFDAQVIPGSEGAVLPIISPDGKWVVYQALVENMIKKISVSGGTATTLCAGSFLYGVTWTADGTIIFGSDKGLLRVSAEGGTPEPLTTVDTSKGEVRHTRPQILPDGRHLLFTVASKDAANSVQFAVMDLNDRSYHTVAKGGLNGQYVRSGHLTYVTDTTMFAVPFDLKTFTVAGAAVPVAERVSTNGPQGTADYSVSDDGLLVYFSGASGTMFAWSDRAGVTTVLKGESKRTWATGKLSPDGRLIASAITGSTQDMWVFDTERGAASRLSFGGEADFPIWTSDSKVIYFQSTQDGKFGIWKVPVDASAKPVRILTTDTPVRPSSISPDGRSLVYTQSDGRIMVLPLSDKGEAGTPKPLHESTRPESDAQISPDGRWVAYVSTEAGTSEIYGHAFPVAGARVRISLGGGIQPRWAANGRELFYRTPEASSSFISVPLPAGAELKPGPSTVLFKGLFGTTWDVTPDRNRFLIELTSQEKATQMAIVTNWFEELRRKAPVRK